jgi:GNAT superfamily N-acetyltransferase
MYGVETLVHPDYQGYGIGGLLMETRFDVARRLNLRGIVGGSLIIDYHKVADRFTPEAYVAEVAAGRLFDTNLSKQIKKGFKPLNPIPDYTFYPLSLNYAIAIVWENPAYRKPEGKIIPFEMPAPQRAVGR